MNKYPNIEDKEFYEKITKIYSKYKVKKEKKTLETICYPKGFKLQLPQQFLSEFINPKTPYMGVLVYHRIGSGKTCTAIRIAEKWKKHKRFLGCLDPYNQIQRFSNQIWRIHSKPSLKF
jgi:hypothetical protein